MVLSRHTAVFHGILNKPPIDDSYTATFLEPPSFYSVDTCDDKWFNKLNAQINIQSVMLPRVK